MYRILVDLDTDAAVRAELATAPSRLRRLVVDALERVLVGGAPRTAGWLRAGTGEMATVTAAELRYLAEPVVAALRRR